jgi:hypothetical protein
MESPIPKLSRYSDVYYTNWAVAVAVEEEKEGIIKFRLALWYEMENIWEDTSLDSVMLKQTNDVLYHDVYLS